MSNVVLTNMLEHLDNPVANPADQTREWLSVRGRIFSGLPNYNAPSRTDSGKDGADLPTTQLSLARGRAWTWIRLTSSDTLERDAVAAGLKVAHRSGIFLEALANFQWDRLSETDIISEEYLEGCYKLGQQYPDLCSSIFLNV